jgi:hypothetical protein
VIETKVGPILESERMAKEIVLRIKRHSETSGTGKTLKGFLGSMKFEEQENLLLWAAWQVNSEFKIIHLH